MPINRIAESRAQIRHAIKFVSSKNAGETSFGFALSVNKWANRPVIGI